MKNPGATREGDYYHIEVRPKDRLTTFRTLDVGDDECVRLSVKMG